MQTLKRPWSAWRRWARKPVPAIVISVLACLLLPYFYGCLCEFVRTGSVYYLRLYLETHLFRIALGAVVTSLIFAGVTLLCARPWVANLLVGGGIVRSQLG